MATKKSFSYTRPFKNYLQFKITLQDIQPEIWRRIQVPEVYTFWDLHVAITDCMPWMDYHLHVFEIKNPKTKTRRKKLIGIPDEDGELKHAPGWEHHIAVFFSLKNRTATYEYDFGDSWMHLVELEEIHPKEQGLSYPRCVDGERACPPEDVGGSWGYEEFLKTISNPKHKEHKSMLRWAQGQTGQSHFDPEKFDPAQVQFDDPDKRWGVAFNDEEMTPDMRGYDPTEARAREVADELFGDEG